MKSNQEKSLFTKRDFWVGLFIIALAAGLLARTTVERAEVMLIPKIVFCLMAVCGVFIAIFSGDSPSLQAIQTSGRESGLSILFLISVILIPIIGFYTVQFLCTIIVIFILQRPLSKAALFRTAGLSLMATVVLYLVFTITLGVQPPRGILI